MKQDSSRCSLKTMDHGKILSGTSFFYPSLVKGFALSLTMFMAAVFLYTACTSRPGTGNPITDSHSAGEAGLTNACRSMEELGRRVIQGINDKDTAALTSLAINKEEYRRYIFPALPIGKVEAWQKEFDYVWGTVRDRSSSRLASIIHNLGGRQLQYTGIRVAGESVTNDVGCIVHKKVKMRWKDASGTEKEAELFAGMVEVNNGFKIESFDVDDFEIEIIEQ